MALNLFTREELLVFLQWGVGGVTPVREAPLIQSRRIRSRSSNSRVRRVGRREVGTAYAGICLSVC